MHSALGGPKRGATATTLFFLLRQTMITLIYDQA
jgi:hypothetical protein